MIPFGAKLSAHGRPIGISEHSKVEYGVAGQILGPVRA